MQLIPCPWCGPREEVEFCYGGQAHIAYPAEPQTLTDQQWTEFVSDAHAMRQAETTLEAGMADLLARPFDESAQLQLRQVLDSDQLRRATQIARSMQEGR